MTLGPIFHVFALSEISQLIIDQFANNFSDLLFWIRKIRNTDYSFSKAFSSCIIRPIKLTLLSDRPKNE